MNGAHRLLSKEVATKTGVCSVCGGVKIKSKGGGRYVCEVRYREDRKRWYATPKGREYVRKHNSLSYRRHVGQSCELCGLTAFVPGLLDGHHKDMNRKNNDKSNIQTLCPTCHRLTHLGKADLVKGMVAVDKPKLQEPGKKTEFELARSEISKLNAMNMRLVEDVARLEGDVKYWWDRFEKAVESTPDQLSAYWKREALKFKAELEKKGEFDQT